jgi:hypothetical protein
MEIGGEDLVLEGPTSDDDWVVVFHAVKRGWPDAVLDRVDSGECMIYRDQQALRHEFASDEVPHGVIHVLVGSDCLTVVVDEEDTEARRLGIAVFESVKSSRG